MKMADRSTRIHGTSTIHSLPKNYTESIAYCVRVQKKKTWIQHSVLFWITQELLSFFLVLGLSSFSFS